MHVITGLDNGGAEAVLYRLIKDDKADNHHIISLLDLGYYGDRLMAAGISVKTLNMPRGQITLRGLCKLFSLIHRIKPDVVQTWMYHADLIGGLCSRIAGIRKVIWGVHNSNLDPDKFKLSTRIVARLCALTSSIIPFEIICCSETAKCFHSEFGYNNNKMIIISNGINLNEFKPNDFLRDKIRSELSIDPPAVLIGMVGRWDSIKDHANLIAALGKLMLVNTKPWYCILVGSGMTEENSELVHLLDKHNVTDRIKLLGPRIDIPAVMNALDLHVLSSSGEAFGNVTVEAMACGVPAIVTSVGAGEFIVKDTGWIVPPSNAVALVGAICLALCEMENKDKWTVRQTACRNRVEENFSLECMINAYKAVWITN